MDDDRTEPTLAGRRRPWLGLRHRKAEAGQPRGAPLLDGNGKPSTWWRRGPRSRRHRYYYPVDNRPGLMLFALIAALGLVAMVVAARHGLHNHGFVHDDRVLGLIGIALLVLGLWQIATLARRRA